jgi:hypothetical protein
MKDEISNRSYAKISKFNLRKLLQLANEDRREFFDRNPRWKKLYADRIICMALCQGAALHYVDKKNGVKDFDVWTLYSENNEAPFPYRRIGHKDFGSSKFGIHPDDVDIFKGRCVDLIGRSLKVSKSANPVTTIRTCLHKPPTKSMAELSKKAVVMLFPEKYFAKIIWPHQY